MSSVVGLTRRCSAPGSTWRCANGRGSRTTASARLDRADRERMAAIEAMFAQHGYAPEEALVRARVLYTMQIGYYALDMREPMEARLALAPHYIETFTGVRPREEELAAFRAYAIGHAGVARLRRRCR